MQKYILTLRNKQVKHFLFSFCVCLVAQSCPTLCDPRSLQPARLLCPWGFSRQEYWSGLPCPSPGDLPNPGIEPRSPILQADSLPSEPLGKPIFLLGNINSKQVAFLPFLKETRRGCPPETAIFLPDQCPTSPLQLMETS